MKHQNKYKGYREELEDELENFFATERFELDLELSERDKEYGFILVTSLFK